MIEVARAAGRGGGDFLHAWVVPLDAVLEFDPAHAAILSPAERERVADFVTPTHGAVFGRCRALLRELLGAYLGRPAAEIEFACGVQGKPRLARDGGSDLEFNLSHTDGMLVLAVTRARAVGVDVECVRWDRAWGDIARQFFSPSEIEAFNRLEPTRQAAAFYGCWTRKEAFVKARGDGMALPPHRYSVTCPPEPAALLDVEGEPVEAGRWALHDFEVGTGYAASIAVEVPAPPLEVRRWDGRPDATALDR